jgi:hypothetical protein
VTKLAANSDENNRRLGSAGACEAVVSVLKKHGERDECVAQNVS